jgi:site-specific DNA-methyltransferase (cytosine-N4-specific)
MPTKLVEPCVLAGSAPGDLVMDPFCGSGTVGVVALRHGRRFVGIDLQPNYLPLAHERIQKSIAAKEKAG